MSNEFSYRATCVTADMSVSKVIVTRYLGYGRWMDGEDRYLVCDGGLSLSIRQSPQSTFTLF